MKLSRRGKSVRRRRHTKRTGKNLRYKGKKIRASKRYHRGIGDRGHTKKIHRKIYRGRVKKGGVGEEHWEEEVTWTKVDGNPPKKQAKGLLVYKKDSTFSLTSESKHFRVTLETQPDLSKVINLNSIKFEVTMERYKKGDDGEVDKVFKIYFNFSYSPLPQYLIDRNAHMSATSHFRDDTNYYLTQLTEDGQPITQSVRVLEPDYTYITKLRRVMPAVFNPNTNRVSINLPEKFSNIKGYDNIINKSKSDNYIFYGETIGLLTNWPDDDKSNTAFFNSLATQMYIILKDTVTKILSNTPQ
jgi:hypothetical protein